MISEKINVGGIAVRPGISKNGILYSVEELNNFAPTLAGRPILKDHSGTTDNTIGIVENSTSDSNGVVSYNGWIKEDGSNILEKINDGRIKEVSIGAFCKQIVKENDDDEYYTAIGVEAMELSTTPVPAVKGTSLSQSLESIEKHKLDSSVKILPIYEQLNKNVEVSNMTDEEKPKEEVAPVEEAPAEEKPAEEEPTAEETPKKEEKIVEQSIKLNVDTSKLDESITKLEKIAKLKEQIKDTGEEVKVDKTHGKVVKETDEEKDDAKEATSEFIVEASDLGTGFSIYKQPKSDGRLS